MSAFLTASLIWTLLVFSSMVVSADQKYTTVEPGDDVTLPCRAAENKPDVVVEWRRTDLESGQYVLLYRNSWFDSEGQSTSFINRVSLLDVKNGDLSLVLKNVIRPDTGTYECRVDYTVKHRRKRSQLGGDPICIINLRVEPGQKLITAETGETVILTCRAAENRDVTVLEWSKTDLETGSQSPSFIKRVDLLNVKNGDLSFVLNDVTTDDTGTYECRVIKREGILQDTDLICIIILIVKPGNKEDGGSSTGLIVVAMLVLTILLFMVLLYMLLKHFFKLCITIYLSLSTPSPDSHRASKAELKKIEQNCNSLTSHNDLGDAKPTRRMKLMSA